ncbi:STAS domain-containing protein [Micromonospora sp. DT47]|uniref:STAS domain-containing protein n=1 Tax=Micromonospora sp. DT47 TaxID=3393431 RepID=UPI003CEC567C
MKGESGVNPEPTWQHEVRAEGDTKTIVLSGEIDINGAAELHTLLQQAVNTASAVNVDVARVTFIDSTVITALVKSHKLARTAGCRFAVVNPDTQVRRVLAVTGVLNALTSDTR